MRIPDPPDLSCHARGLDSAGRAALLWVVGIDNAAWDFEAAAPGAGGGANSTFVQENGTVNALPGNPASAETDGLSDNDYYFAGSYTIGHCFEWRLHPGGHGGRQ